MRVLGTDSFERSEIRESPRHFFQVDAVMICVAASYRLSQRKTIAVEQVERAIEELGIDREKPDPARA